jgi:hypothetical protein
MVVLFWQLLSISVLIMKGEPSDALGDSHAVTGVAWVLVQSKFPSLHRMLTL